jgi:glycyl-tRNA synthetase
MCVHLFSTYVFYSERDTMDQRIGPIDEVIAVVTELVNGNMTWDEACHRLPAYDGVQAIE